MTATLDPGSLPPRPAVATIGVLERSRAVLARAARVMGAAANLEWVAADDDPARLRAQLGGRTRLVGCAAEDLDVVRGWTSAGVAEARIAAWGRDPSALLEIAERDERLVSLIGWPSFQSAPRTWELALATRAILAHGPDGTTLADLFAGYPAVAEHRPRTPPERARAVAEVAAVVERAGASDRLAARIGEVAHELIMNATFDAPVDARGEPRYAHDRRAPVVLADGDAPVVQLATNGVLVALQVADRFGRLTREHVLASLRRGASAGRAAAAEVVDRSGGGAGLGLWRVYAGSAVTVVDVVPGQATVVTAVFDLDVAARDARTLPPSLHLFDRGRLG